MIRAWRTHEIPLYLSVFQVLAAQMPNLWSSWLKGSVSTKLDETFYSDTFRLTADWRFSSVKQGSFESIKLLAILFDLVNAPYLTCFLFSQLENDGYLKSAKCLQVNNHNYQFQKCIYILQLQNLLEIGLEAGIILPFIAESI